MPEAAQEGPAGQVLELWEVQQRGDATARCQQVLATPAAHPLARSTAALCLFLAGAGSAEEAGVLLDWEVAGPVVMSPPPGTPLAEPESLSWTPLPDLLAAGAAPLEQVFGGLDGQTLWLRTELHGPFEGQLRLGFDGALTALLGSEVLGVIPAPPGGHAWDRTALPLELGPGVHPLTLVLSTRRGRARVSARLDPVRDVLDSLVETPLERLRWARLDPAVEPPDDLAGLPPALAWPFLGAEERSALRAGSGEDPELAALWIDEARLEGDEAGAAGRAVEALRIWPTHPRVVQAWVMSAGAALGPRSQLRAIEAALVAHPGHGWLNRRRDALQRRLETGPAARIAVGPVAGTPAAQRRRVEVLLAAGDCAAAAAQATRSAARWRWLPEVQAVERQVRARCGDPAGALEAVAALRARWPQGARPVLARTWWEEARLRTALDEDPEPALREALRLDPGLDEARRWLRSLGSAPVSFHGYEVGPQELLRSARRPIESAGAVEVLVDQRVLDWRGETATEVVQRAWLLKDPEAADALRLIRWPWDDETETAELLEATLIDAQGAQRGPLEVRRARRRERVNGAWIEVNEIEIELPEPQVGSVVALSVLHTERRGRQRFAGARGHLQRLSGSLPRHLARVVVVHDDPVGWSGERPRQRRVGGARHTIWQRRRVPAEARESHAPGPLSRDGLVSVAGVASWEAIGHWWAQLVAPQWRLSSHQIAIAERLEADWPDPRQRALALFEWVRERVFYNGLEFGEHGWRPWPAEDVLQRGYGDCKDMALVLAALGEAAGLQPELLMVQTRARGAGPLSPPNPRIFDHAIVGFPELGLYLDATDRFGPAESLRADVQGAHALAVRRDGSSALVRIPLAPAASNLSRTEIELHLQAEGPARFLERWTETGAGVAGVRRSYPRPADRARALEADYQRRLPGFVLEEAEFAGFERGATSLGLTLRGQLPWGTAESIPPTPFPAAFGAGYASLASRSTDLVLAHPSRQEHRVRLHPPAGARLEPPEAAAIDHPCLSYQRTAHALPDGGVELIESLELPCLIVPRADYPGFRAAALAVDAIQSLPLALR